MGRWAAVLALDRRRPASPPGWLLAPVPDIHCDSRASAYGSSGTVCPQSWALTTVWEHRSPTQYPCLEIPVLIPPDCPSSSLGLCLPICKMRDLQGLTSELPPKTCPEAEGKKACGDKDLRRASGPAGLHVPLTLLRSLVSQLLQQLC